MGSTSQRRTRCFSAVREGWDFFHDPFWRGPMPTFEIWLVAGDWGGRVGRKMFH